MDVERLSPANMKYLVPVVDPGFGRRGLIFSFSLSLHRW
jgi:hypothetical protein